MKKQQSRTSKQRNSMKKSLINFYITKQQLFNETKTYFQDDYCLKTYNFHQIIKYVLNKGGWTDFHNKSIRHELNQHQLSIKISNLASWTSKIDSTNYLDRIWCSQVNSDYLIHNVYNGSMSGSMFIKNDAAMLVGPKNFYLLNPQCHKFVKAQEIITFFTKYEILIVFCCNFV